MDNFCFVVIELFTLTTKINKAEMCACLEKKKFNTNTEREIVFDMKEISDVKLSYPNLEVKNLFIHDDKKRKYYPLSIHGDRHVDLKKRVKYTLFDLWLSVTRWNIK
ncbi:hypothetical protein EDI_211350 [Entamoeba dispar SAW760]|uniref:Uncharacterized protein n=1 Tax=Entamoeba dispar (strain ATCC PRA-260 / SAW760) TaxID=370354 RepID=B0EIR0_ENTDS|nr:uncharacterized protein EDI_211350 [Entamoeba dispar SAW760]EDR25586.1 hypothetical protein EDI_211350 [Entamoeba dispar SAW760]|eukprot:EDR25586.1 hypothetical protein EDI_211350 [Entamoeba dispar SAW760]